MDPGTLAMLAVQALVPFFKQVGERAVGRVAEGLGDAVLDRAQRLYERVKRALAGDPADEALVEGVRAAPDDPDRQEFLQRRLARLLERDPELAAEIERLVGEVRQAGGVQMAVTDSGAVAGGNVTIEGDYAAGRDLTINSPPPPRPQP
jgi:hypothetical protein